MPRLIDSDNLVMEPRYEQHRGSEIGRTVVYTPEGEYLLDVEVSETGIDPHFSMVMDAGVVDKGVFGEILREEDVHDVISLTDKVPEESFLGDVSDPDFYNSPAESGMEVVCYSIEDDEWNVHLENPLTDYPARLMVDGSAEQAEEVKDVFSSYAGKVSVHSLSHSDRYSRKGYILDESDISHWSEDDWRNVLDEALELAVRTTSIPEDYRPADD
ncbi:MAG: hypothetical protein ABEK10_00010 [Candidatus Nanosalina sp.]